MKKWQKIISEHQEIKIIDDMKIIVKNVLYDTINKVSHDDIITKVVGGYIDKEGNKYKTVWEYLGY